MEQNCHADTSIASDALRDYVRFLWCNVDASKQAYPKILFKGWKHQTPAARSLQQQRALSLWQYRRESRVLPSMFSSAKGVANCCWALYNALST
jgi:hypothetical protein